MKLYLCDPAKNSTCRGTVCFYGSGPFRLCYACTDPACAVTGPEGGALEIPQDDLMENVCVDKREPKGPIYEEVRSHAAAENADETASNL